MREMLTIFSEAEEPIGIKERGEVHVDGDWHETFHCWMFQVTEGKMYLLLQLRSRHKKDFPSLYDITAAGHIEAGEDVWQAGVREIEEEIGVSVKPEELIPQGHYKEQLQVGDLLDREICRVYFLPWTVGMEFSLGEEVEDVIKVSLEDMVAKDEGVPMKGVSLLNGKERIVRQEDFVPHEKGYERYIIQSLREYVEKL